MRKPTSKSTKSTKSSTVKKTTMRSLITSLVRKNPKMSDGEIYLNVLRSGGVKTNNINLTSFFSRMSNYPSIRSVYEVTRAARSKMNSTKKASTTPRKTTR